MISGPSVRKCTHIPVYASSHTTTKPQLPKKTTTNKTGLRALAAALRTGHLSQLTRLELSGNNLVGGEPPPDGADAAAWLALLPFLEEGGRDERAMQAFAGALEVGGWLFRVRVGSIGWQASHATQHTNTGRCLPAPCSAGAGRHGHGRYGPRRRVACAQARCVSIRPALPPPSSLFYTPHAPKSNTANAR